MNCKEINCKEIDENLPSGNLNMDFNTAVACVRSALISNFDIICGSTGHLKIVNAFNYIKNN